MGKYTLELTFDELHILSKAITREYDRLDDLRDPKVGDCGELEERIHDMYMDARRTRESERAWISAERDRV
jgi:hypothetical protein